MRSLPNAARIAAAALAIALSAPAQAQSDCSECPSAERAAHERREAQQQARETENLAFQKAFMDYQQWNFRAVDAFKTALSAAERERRRALGSPRLRLPEGDFELDRLATATRRGGSAIITLSAEGAQTLGARSPQARREALERIASALKTALAPAVFESRVFAPPPTPGHASQPERLALVFERWPESARPPAPSATVSERFLPEGEALFARLAQAAKPIQARDPSNWARLVDMASAPPAIVFDEFRRHERARLDPDSLDL